MSSSFHKSVNSLGLLMILGIAVRMVDPALAQRQAPEPETVLLWPNGAPGAIGTEDIDKPTLTLYPAPEERNTGAAVVLCPGGSYRAHVMNVEMVRWLHSLGVGAFVLRYRLGPRYHHPAPLDDVQRALRYVRLNAKRFGVDRDRLGVWGFSAGGHLAATAATHFDRGNPAAGEPIDRMSARPDFAILSYAVISMTTEYTHERSRLNLLGENPDPKLLELLSNEKQVTKDTPPTFLYHTNEDAKVPPENSVLFYLALRKAGVPAELHIYEHGAHGTWLEPTDLTLSSWPRRLADWLYGRGLLTAPRTKAAGSNE